MAWGGSAITKFIRVRGIDRNPGGGEHARSQTTESPRMIALIQRVSAARVDVDGTTVGAIGAGLLAFIAVQPDDSDASAERLLDRVLGYRVFADADGRMNRSLAQTGGGLLLVSQFTLAADTRSGLRAGFSTAAVPAVAERLFGHLVERARQRHAGVESGRFGAHMEVHLVNDGPVTFWLEAG